MKLHNLLKRQLKKSFGKLEGFPDQLQQFIEKVNRAYVGFDEDRELIERSLDLMSDELVERYEKLKNENNKLVETQEKLVEEEKKLEASIEEKEVLLKEIHHRVKNNLAAISGLLFLQAETEEDEKLRAKLSEAQNRIHSMAMIHEMLYKNDSFSAIRIDEYISKLLHIITANFNPDGVEISLEINAQDLLVDIESAVPISLLLNEAIINSLKYAFPDRGKGEITINFACITEDLLELKVSDNGIGISSDIDLDNPSTLGYSLIKTFVAQLNGDLELKRDNGTELIIVFPMNSIVKRKNVDLIKDKID